MLARLLLLESASSQRLSSLKSEPDNLPVARCASLASIVDMSNEKCLEVALLILNVACTASYVSLRTRYLFKSQPAAQVQFPF